MSLVQHVSIDGVDHEPAPSDLEHFVPIRKKLSYDVFPPQQELSSDKNRTPPYKVSTAKRLGV
jgi:hypothetical protein